MADGPAEQPPAGVFDLVKYDSQAGKLAAYVTPDPKDGKKHPAIVFACTAASVESAVRSGVMHRLRTIKVPRRSATLRWY